MGAPGEAGARQQPPRFWCSCFSIRCVLNRGRTQCAESGMQSLNGVHARETIRLLAGGGQASSYSLGWLLKPNGTAIAQRIAGQMRNFNPCLTPG